MATVRKLAGLFRAIAADDLAGASAVASEICKAEQRQGHGTAARLLRGALHANGLYPRTDGAQALAAASPGLLSTALVQLPADTQLRDVVLAPTRR